MIQVCFLGGSFSFLGSFYSFRTAGFENFFFFFEGFIFFSGSPSFSIILHLIYIYGCLCVHAHTYVVWVYVNREWEYRVREAERENRKSKNHLMQGSDRQPRRLDDKSTLLLWLCSHSHIGASYSKLSMQQLMQSLLVYTHMQTRTPYPATFRHRQHIHPQTGTHTLTYTRAQRFGQIRSKWYPQTQNNAFFWKQILECGVSRIWWQDKKAHTSRAQHTSAYLFQSFALVQLIPESILRTVTQRFIE